MIPVGARQFSEAEILSDPTVKPPKNKIPVEPESKESGKRKRLLLPIFMILLTACGVISMLAISAGNNRFLDNMFVVNAEETEDS